MTFRDIIRKVAEGFFVENFGFVRAVSSNFYVWSRTYEVEDSVFTIGS